MKKRLRKKLKIAEFKELGFFVTGTFNPIEEVELDLFFQKLVEFAESKDMQCGGGYNTEEFEIFVNTGKAGDDNEALRKEFVAMVEAAKKEIKEFEATDLLDAYYEDAEGHEDGCECGCCH